METGCSLKRHSWDATPMTQEVIDEVLECGKNENSPDGIIVHDYDFNVDVDHNKFEHDDIKGVHDCDTQHNLCPQNNNNHINQTDDGDNSSHSDSKQEDDNFSHNDCESEHHNDECIFGENT